MRGRRAGSRRRPPWRGGGGSGRAPRSRPPGTALWVFCPGVEAGPRLAARLPPFLTAGLLTPTPPPPPALQSSPDDPRFGFRTRFFLLKCCDAVFGVPREVPALGSLNEVPLTSPGSPVACCPWRGKKCLSCLQSALLTHKILFS